MHLGMKMNVQIHNAHRFNFSRFEKWYRANIRDFGTLREIVQISGGVSNPTFFLTTEDGSERREFVPRKQPPGNLLPSAHQVDREYRIMEALTASGVPVPKMHALCVDTEIIGTKFYVMERLHGRVFS